MTDTEVAMLWWAILFLAVLTDKTGQKRRGQVALAMTSPLTCPAGNFGPPSGPPWCQPNSPHPVAL